uniref:Uncharacterized protein n=1 Tax=Sphaerodactylus townsendi TaxID=933632 RepID=A0ACB8F0D1_9SAUR
MVEENEAEENEAEKAAERGAAEKKAGESEDRTGGTPHKNYRFNIPTAGTKIDFCPSWRFPILIKQQFEKVLSKPLGALSNKVLPSCKA